MQGKNYIKKDFSYIFKALKNGMEFSIASHPSFSIEKGWASKYYQLLCCSPFLYCIMQD